VSRNFLWHTWFKICRKHPPLNFTLNQFVDACYFLAYCLEKLFTKSSMAPNNHTYIFQIIPSFPNFSLPSITAPLKRCEYAQRRGDDEKWSKQCEMPVGSELEIKKWTYYSPSHCVHNSLVHSVISQAHSRDENIINQYIIRCSVTR
jgi:hypothetical protein